MAPSRSSRRTLIAACAMLAWLGAMAGAGLHLRSSESSSRRALTERLQSRIAAGAEFASLYVRDVLHRERAQAAAWLTDRSTTNRQLRLATSALNAPAAMLLDARGQILRDNPAQPRLRGVDMALVYPQLARAESGHSDVSDAVSSTTDGQPMVAFAVPFSTAHGRRVLSVEFPASETPLGQYSDHLLTIPGHRTYIVDGNGTLIAGSRSTAVGTTLSHVDPPIARALRSAPTGTEGSGSSRQVFVSSKVPGTPWTMAASEPADQLFASVDGPGHSLAWLALAGLSLAGLIIIAITARLARSRTRLLELTRELERLARIDSLTSVSNRRDLEERLAAAACAANRNGSPMSVLLVDIDRFKCVNDTLGHQRGDEVLIATASAMHASLRANDVIGRWGGEEFLAILPDTDLEGAAVVAERLRQRVRTTVAAGDRPVTVTIGVAGLDERGVSALVARADTALYAGKAAGRDTVEVSAGAPADEPTVLTPALV